MSEAVIETPAHGSKRAEMDFERLYRSSRDDVYAYAVGLLRNRAAAEDVTATAFERGYRKRSRYRPEKGSPRAWLFGIARNAALDELRRRGRHADLDPERIDEATVKATSEDGQGELRLIVAAALTKLGARERELIALKFFAGLSNGEIASVVGISASNVGTRLNRTMDKLREACDGAL